MDNIFDVNPADLELLALTKNPIYVDSIPIYPITLNQIATMGYSIYRQALNIISISKDEADSYLVQPLPSDNLVYDFLILSMYHDERIKRVVLIFLAQLCRCQVTLNEKTGILEAKNFTINRNNYLPFQAIVKFRNCIKKTEDEIENPANDKARELLEKRKKLRKRLQKLKSDATDDISLSDLVSILASGLGLSIDTVMNYDMYQFNDQFNRLKIFKDYDVNIQALLHGASSDDIQIKHWISKIESPNED